MSQNKTALVDYYAQRAHEYEKIYAKPERQDDLRNLERTIPEFFCGKKVLEIACGTGYWTQSISHTANEILGIDYNPEVLEIAETKDYRDCPVNLTIDDAYSLNNVSSNYDAAFCGFWWSHIPISKVPEFLTTLHSRLKSQSPIVLLDNLFVAGSSTPIAREDPEGNTYQIRTLQDGTRHEVLKNFPDKTKLEKSIDGYGLNFSYQKYNYFWLVHYTVA